MAITFAERVKKQRYLIFVLVVLIFVITFVVWRGHFVKEKVSEEGELKPVKKIEINFNILKNPLLEQFQIIEPIPPIGIEEIGRDNPFIPY